MWIRIPSLNFMLIASTEKHIKSEYITAGFRFGVRSGEVEENFRSCVSSPCAPGVAASMVGIVCVSVTAISQLFFASLFRHPNYYSRSYPIRRSRIADEIHSPRVHLLMTNKIQGIIFISGSRTGNYTNVAQFVCVEWIKPVPSPSRNAESHRRFIYPTDLSQWICPHLWNRYT